MTTTGSAKRMGRVVVCAALLLAMAAPARAQHDPASAPVTTASNGGRTASGAGLTLSVSQATGLAADGQAVTVTGTGYDETKGVYVSLCVVPPPNTTPSPCGGGVDRENTSGASAWISSNPPSYAGNVATPYGPGGSFSVTIDISPSINADLDCLSVRCAIVTRNDHTRGSDRSQDVLIPVSFAAPPAPGQPSETPSVAPPPDAVATTTTVPEPDPTSIAPTTELSADRKTVTDGERSLTVTRVDDLDPSGTSIAVRGSGFDDAGGIYVALCRLPDEGEPPGPCSADAAAAWIASDPPDYAADLAQPFADDGTFEVTLDVRSVIDGDTDCREVACAITSRRDHSAPDDRTNDLAVPVTFAMTASTDTSPTSISTTTSTTADGTEVEIAATDDTRGSNGGSSWMLTGAGLAAVVLAGAWTALQWRRRSRAVT